MADVQIDDGYTKVANELLEAIMRINLSSYEFRVIMAIMRKTYGYRKKQDYISLSQLEEITGIKACHVCRTLKKLKDKNMILSNGHLTGIQKDYDLWKVTQTGNGGNWRNETNWQSNPISKIKQNIINRDKECVVCGSKKDLCVHHIDYNQENNNENNLITVCKSCHGKTNSKNQEKWISFFNEIITHSGNTQIGNTQIGNLPKQVIPKHAIEITQTGNKKLPKQVDTKEKKETYTKEIVYIVEYLNKKALTNYKSTTEKNRELIRARLNEGFTVSDFEKVIDNKITDWTGTEWERFIRPLTLFGTKFESYLNEKPKGGANAHTNRSIKRFDNERLDDSEKAGFYANITE